MAGRITLTVSVEKTGRLIQTQVRIGTRDIRLINGRAVITATAGNEYWLYWYIEGPGGSSIALTIEDSSGAEKVKLEDKRTKIPPGLGRNGGTKSFVA